MIEGIGGDKELWEEIQKQFEKIKEESGIEPDDEYLKEIEDLLGISIEEMNNETEIALKTKNLKYE
jgi:ribosome-binding protein aMBF1 (putative translation factor)